PAPRASRCRRRRTRGDAGDRPPCRWLLARSEWPLRQRLEAVRVEDMDHALALVVHERAAPPIEANLLELRAAEIERVDDRIAHGIDDGHIAGRAPVDHEQPAGLRLGPDRLRLDPGLSDQLPDRARVATG